MNRTKIKLCGMSRPEDIAAVNELMPDYIGFVLFFPKSSRNITPEKATELRALLHPSIQAVGVFVDAPVEAVARLLQQGVIDMAQLHGHEDNAYIETLRAMTGRLILKAFKLRTPQDATDAESSAADYVLLDNGTGTGQKFDWSLITGIRRPFFLAGGLDPDNAAQAVAEISPYAVDVSSGIETNKVKDAAKMRAFVQNVRAANERS